MSDISAVLLFLLLAGIAIGIRLIAGRVDRDRIRKYIEDGGGTVLEIIWNPMGPGWWGSRDRIYDVSYRTHHGEVRKSICKTGMFSGVYWTGEAPPSGLMESHESSYRTGEAIDCLKCGSKIPPRQSRCPKCGWSYTSQSSR